MDYQEDLEKKRADSAEQSREGYKKDQEKSHDDSAEQSCESYMKDPEKSCARSRDSYMKDPGRVVLTVQYKAIRSSLLFYF